jgi:hypothetical protein
VKAQLETLVLQMYRRGMRFEEAVQCGIDGRTRRIGWSAGRGPY